MIPIEQKRSMLVNLKPIGSFSGKFFLHNFKSVVNILSVLD
ncbi:hypothetical protein VRK_17250 [Vibrio sp. MEBiC08052]|nr:hypothetical protein VRK_17250 [Vibrio sp. MEBiC08052]